MLRPISKKEALALYPELNERNNHDYGIDFDKARFSIDEFTSVVFIDIDHMAPEKQCRRIYVFDGGEWSFSEQT